MKIFVSKNKKNPRLDLKLPIIDVYKFIATFSIFKLPIFSSYRFISCTF